MSKCGRALHPEPALARDPAPPSQGDCQQRAPLRRSLPLRPTTGSGAPRYRQGRSDTAPYLPKLPPRAKPTGRERPSVSLSASNAVRPGEEASSRKKNSSDFHKGLWFVKSLCICEKFLIRKKFFRSPLPHLRSI